MASIYRSSFAVGVALLLASCAKAVPELPADRMEAAATCYAARTVALKTETLTAEQANEVAHFLFLGAVNDGLASPTALQQSSVKGNALQDRLSEAGNAAAYAEPCARRFPATAAGSFKGLPADSRDTRMTCYTLATSVLQTYQSSGVTAPPPLAAMHEKLDTSLMAEINGDGAVNPAEVAGLAMRSMAKAAEAGPVTEVLKACTGRYGA